MRTGRTISAFLLALSLAMLPMAGAFAVPKDEVAASDTQVASAHECCDDEGMPAGHAMKECQGPAGCVAKCCKVFAVVVATAMILSPMCGMESRVACNLFCSHMGNPPFRPPRV